MKGTISLNHKNNIRPRKTATEKKNTVKDDTKKNNNKNNRSKSQETEQKDNEEIFQREVSIQYASIFRNNEEILITNSDYEGEQY